MLFLKNGFLHVEIFFLMLIELGKLQPRCNFL